MYLSLGLCLSGSGVCLNLHPPVPLSSLLDLHPCLCKHTSLKVCGCLSLSVPISECLECFTCVSHFSTSLSVYLLCLFTTARPSALGDMSPRGRYRWFCASCMCPCLCVYLSSKLSLCGSLSLHIRPRSLFFDPLPVGEPPPPLPELSPVRARGRVRDSGMLSAD